jgi:exopolysaccharide biosynthesis polyprenyl glycosylphosphotransferase
MDGRHIQGDAAASRSQSSNVVPLRSGVAAAAARPLPEATETPPARFREAEPLAQIFRIAPVIVDALAVTAALLALGVSGVGQRLVLIPAITLAWLLLVRSTGGYQTGLGRSVAAEAKSVAFAGFVGVLTLLELGPLAGVQSSASTQRALAVVIVLFVLGRSALRLAERAVRRPALVHRVLVVGDGPEAHELLSNLDAWPGLELDVVGICANTSANTVEGLPVLGFTRSCVLIARDLGVETVFLAPSALSAEEVSKLQGLLLDAGIEVMVVPNMGQLRAERVTVRQLGGIPVLSLQPRQSAASRAGKRLFDLVAAAVLVAVFTPVLAAIALLVRLDSAGPVVFRQQRVGKGGALFTLWKFRTMTVDAESRRSELRAERDAGDGLFKLQHDPRVTRVGRWLRRTSLDELPQLWNVLRGEMSLVGPRPALPEEVAEFDDFTLRRLIATPGITGLWQVSGRSDTSFETYSRLDAFYAENWSVRGDFAILGRTLPAVLRSRGAY